MKLNFPKGFWYKSLDSTMDEAKRLIKAGKIKDTAFVVAHHQTHGRGTHGRKWVSPSDAGIYLSIIHLSQENAPFPSTSLYTIAATLASVKAIKETTDIQPYIKPINDIYFNERKLGGILIESELKINGVSKLITGIGINTHKASRLIEDTTIAPISIEEILTPTDFQKISFQLLIKTIVNQVCFFYEKIFSRQEKEIKQEWEKIIVKS